MQALEGVRAALQEGSAAVAAQAAGVVQAVIADLAEHCSGVLKQLRGIIATYRCPTAFCTELVHTCWLQCSKRVLKCVALGAEALQKADLCTLLDQEPDFALLHDVDRSRFMSVSAEQHVVLGRVSCWMGPSQDVDATGADKSQPLRGQHPGRPQGLPRQRGRRSPQPRRARRHRAGGSTAL